MTRVINPFKLIANRRYFPTDRMAATNLFEMIDIEGGPLIRQSDGTLVGVASFHFTRTDGVQVQGFANVANFYAWMAYWTGMDLPKCRNQALVYETIG